MFAFGLPGPQVFGCEGSSRKSILGSNILKSDREKRWFFFVVEVSVTFSYAEILCQKCLTTKR